MVSGPKFLAGAPPSGDDWQDVLGLVSGSPAASAGVCVGHSVCLERDGPPHVRLFFDPDQKRRYRVEFSCGDIGILTRPSESTLKARLSRSKSVEMSLLRLWERGQSEGLLTKCSKELYQLSGSGFLARLRKKVKPENSPLTALYGAALWDSGSTDEAKRWLELYLADYASNHAPEFQALALHILALSNKDIPQLKMAYRYGCLLPTERALEELAAPTPPLYGYRVDGLPSSNGSGLRLLLVRSSRLGREISEIEDWLSENGMLVNEVFPKLESLDRGDAFYPVFLNRDNIVLEGGLGPGQVWKAVRNDRFSSEAKMSVTREELVSCALPLRQLPPPWPVDGHELDQHVRYLVVGEQPPGLDIDPLLDGCPQSWDQYSPVASTLSLSEVEARFGNASSQALFRHVGPAAQQDNVLLLESKFTTASFAPLQTSMAHCRSYLRRGAFGVFDLQSQRWFSDKHFSLLERDTFEVRDQIGTVAENGVLRTQGLLPKFSVQEFALRYVSPYFIEAAHHLLMEVAQQAALGKIYTEKSLFRWRSGAYLCQFMFRPMPEDESVLEVVDMHLKNGVVNISTNAVANLKYFTLAAPHWNLGYGWPPQLLPELPTAGEDSFYGLVPGSSHRRDAEALLGPPTKTEGEYLRRWVFENQDGFEPFRVELGLNEDGTINSICSNLGSAAVDDPTFSREYRAAPDQALVRTERVQIRSHPLISGETLLINQELDPTGTPWQTTLAHFVETPDFIRAELEGSFQSVVLTGFTSQLPEQDLVDSKQLKLLRTCLESSIRIIGDSIRQFGRHQWQREDLNGYAMVIGTYLILGKIPERDALQALGLPPAMFLEAFVFLEEYLQHPTTQLRFAGQAQKKDLEFRSLAAFHWLISNLTLGEPTEQDSALSVDLAQIFESYRVMLKEVLVSTQD